MNENLFNEVENVNVNVNADVDVNDDVNTEVINEMIVDAKVQYVQLNKRADKLLLHLDKSIPCVIKDEDEVFQKTLRPILILPVDYIVMVMSAKLEKEGLNIKDLITNAAKEGVERIDVIASQIFAAGLKIKATLREAGTAYNDNGDVLNGDKYDYQVVVMSLRKQVYDLVKAAGYQLAGFKVEIKL